MKEDREFEEWWSKTYGDAFSFTSTAAIRKSYKEIAFAGWTASKKSQTF